MTATVAAKRPVARIHDHEENDMDFVIPLMESSPLLAIIALFASALNIYLLIYICYYEGAISRFRELQDYFKIFFTVRESVQIVNFTSIDPELLYVPDLTPQSINATKESLSWSGLLEFFPNLRNVSAKELNAVLLTPRAQIRKKLMVGIPVFERSSDNIDDTLSSLFSLLGDKYKENIVFLVMFATDNRKYIRLRTKGLRKKFANDINAGLLEITAIPPSWYKAHTASSPSTSNKSAMRMHWRTKQNLDYFYIMTYAKSRCEYYLQLDDNIEAVAAYDRVIFGYITVKQGKDWFVMNFADMGFTGKLFSDDSLNYMTTALAMYYRFKPVNWILKDILRSQYCNPGMDDKVCAQAISSHCISSGSSQFQHRGVISSSNRKIHKIRGSNAIREVTMEKRSNPPANVTTEMKAYSFYDSQRGYDYKQPMWFLSPRKDDSVDITFKKPLNITGIMFLSGVPPGLNDKLGPGTIVAGSDDRQCMKLGEFTPEGDFVFRCKGIIVFELQIVMLIDIDHSVLIDHIVIDDAPINLPKTSPFARFA
ncbi:unnamed protein product [Cylicocyclus nassatus]|uniref:MGAT4 conserved region domain-containing protein n=1 Tax=Cylicocyclus nassatus TaxID=53992 RepID=A0AA36DR51_CYLNA|nr:unnamed protein product [Cylicocyclus nassatus]